LPRSGRQGLISERIGIAALPVRMLDAHLDSSSAENKAGEEVRVPYKLEKHPA
jgi:hypothetical protein